MLFCLLQKEQITMNELKDGLRVFVVPTEILDMEELTTHEKMVYMVLRSYANGHDNSVFPSIQTIAKKGSMSKPTAIKCLDRLIELGLVVKEERKKVSKNGKISSTSNLYYLYRPSEINGGGKGDLPGVVKQVNQGSKGDLPGVVKQVNPKISIIKRTIKKSINKNQSIYLNEELETIIQDVFKEDIKEDWIDSIYTIYDLFKDEITLPAFKRVLNDVKKHSTNIDNLEHYLKAAIKNEIKPKSKTAVTKKIIRNEPTPDWLVKNTAQGKESVQTKKPIHISEERKKAIWAQVEKLNKGN
jgi:predicted transcriptional regulator